MDIENVKSNAEILKAIQGQALNNVAQKVEVKYKGKPYIVLHYDPVTLQYLLGCKGITADPGFWVSGKNISWATNDLN